MTKLPGLVIAVCLTLAGPALAQSPARRVALGDWPEARGPRRDGVSLEKGLPDSWDVNKGTNLLWRAPFGGRSAPIVMGSASYSP